MSAVPKATQDYAGASREHGFQATLSLIAGETADGGVLLRCVELPISGSGSNRDEALNDLFQQLYLYRTAQAYGQRPASFTSGLASLWDFAGFGLRPDPFSPDVDALAAATDWYAVGSDLASAIQRFDGQMRTRSTEHAS